MTSISTIPSTRVSDAYVIHRLVTQLHGDQSDLTRVQYQLTSGMRMAVPSEDPPAALRALSVQTLMERKAQVKTNLSTNQTFLTATDSALNQASGMLADLRALAIGVNSSTTGDAERASAVAQIERAEQQLVDTANQVFRGRFLFSGSQTSQRPYGSQNGYIKYDGDEKYLSSYSDIDVLFETNLPGSIVFGGVSAPVRGVVDLNPVLTDATPLALLRGGLGIDKGSLSVSDGNGNRSVIDISSASTIGDVAALLTNNPPPGRTLAVHVASTGLLVQLDAAGGGNLTIDEVGSGTTAAELGIRNTTGVGVGVLTGTDIDPIVSLTTPLQNVLGARASAYVPALGRNNDLIFEAATLGAAFNGATINLVDDSKLQAAVGLTAGNERIQYDPNARAAVASLSLSGLNNDLLLRATTAGAQFNGVQVDLVNGGAMGNAATAAYNAGTKTLTLTVDGTGATSTDALIAAIDGQGTFSAARDASAEPNVAGGFVPATFSAGFTNTYNSGGNAKTLYVFIQPGASTANGAIAAVNAEGTFTARLDASEVGNDGTGVLLDAWSNPAATGVTSGGTGRALDQASGLQIVNGGATHVIDVSTAVTVEDLLNILNGGGAGVLAEINSTATGIDVRSRVAGADFAIGENGGTTAADLGIRSFTLATPLASLNYGKGVQHDLNGDFIVHRPDGAEFTVDTKTAIDIGDVIDLVNTNPNNVAAGTQVLARLSTYGNGIELYYDGPPAGTETLAVRGVDSATPATQLGLLPVGASVSNPPTTGALASVSLVIPGANNDLTIQAATPGLQVNGVTVRFVDTGLGAGNETVAFNAATRVLTFDVDTATTTAAGIAGVLAGSPLSATFNAVLANSDPGNTGTGLVGLGGAGTLTGGTLTLLAGRDVNPQETAGVFTAIRRLHDAVKAKDYRGIERAVELLDDGYRQLNFARGELGARQQALDVLDVRLQDEHVELRKALSADTEIDLIEATAELTARQTALEAALRTIAAVNRLSLLDFL